MRRVPSTRFSWRIQLAGSRNAIGPGVVLQRAIMINPNDLSPTAADLAELRAEAPDSDGIRRRFVERIRQLIAAGHYDSPERWAIAEELLVRKLEDAR
jgi:hypothetical protein